MMKSFACKVGRGKQDHKLSSKGETERGRSRLGPDLALVVKYDRYEVPQPELRPVCGRELQLCILRTLRDGVISDTVERGTDGDEPATRDSR